MASIKYADLGTMERVASYVNSKLAFASVMPESPIDNQLVLYIGATTADYTCGGVYKYNDTDSEWELINFTQPIILTYAEFLELPQAVQESGHFIVEDYPGVDGGGTIEGYYNSTDGKFYEDDQYTTEIPGEAGMLYVGLDNDTIYRYDETDDEFIAVGGGNGTVIKYVETLPVSGIENIIYGYDSVTSNAEVTADGFLDTDDNFVKTGNTYVAKVGIYVEASSDGVNYDEFDSLEYDDTNSEFILTYADGLTDVIAVGSTFYWKVDARLYYAGDEEHQTLTLLASSGGGGTGAEYVAGNAIDITGNVISAAYQAGSGIAIEDDEISSTDFIGTRSTWDALSAAEKAKYDQILITDDQTQLDANPGHEIFDGATAKVQREGLKFVGFDISDDSVGNKTVVEEIPYTAGDGIEITNKEVSVDETRPSTFIGTVQEWEGLTSEQKAQYTLVNLTNDPVVGPQVVVDAVQDGNYSPITSNAVYDEFQDRKLVVEKIESSSMTTQPSTYSHYQFSISKAGYTPIGIMGVQTYTVSIIPCEWAIVGNTCSIYVQNISTSALTGTMRADILYQKN